ncbi:MAG TPA: hypothetical protein VE684_09810, partial [Crenalkalicoccus sp.]|nr:hypothetical protein [Crenalkalicoccus sp.]
GNRDNAECLGRSHRTPSTRRLPAAMTPNDGPHASQHVQSQAESLSLNKFGMSAKGGKRPFCGFDQHRHRLAQ